MNVIEQCTTSDVNSLNLENVYPYDRALIDDEP